MSESNNHPNRTLSPEEKKAKQDRRMEALRAVAQVHADSAAPAEQLAAEATKLANWVERNRLE